jgi:hypothetical protein
MRGFPLLIPQASSRNKMARDRVIMCWANMYSAAKIGLKRDILEGDNAAGWRHYHGVVRGKFLRGCDNAPDRALG